MFHVEHLTTDDDDVYYSSHDLPSLQLDMETPRRRPSTLPEVLVATEE